MPTSIVYTAHRGKGDENDNVRENVEEVAEAVNDAKRQQDEWIVVHEAESGKAFAVRIETLTLIRET